MDKYVLEAYGERIPEHESRLLYQDPDVEELEWAINEEKTCHQNAYDFEREVISSIVTIKRGDEEAINQYKTDMIQLSRLRGYVMAVKEYRGKLETLLFGEWDTTVLP